MGRVLPIIVLIALTVYCTVEVAQARTLDVRYMPKWLWAVVVIGIPLVGPLAWLLFGRPLSRPQHPSGAARPTAPPDDNPDFLRRL